MNDSKEYIGELLNVLVNEKLKRVHSFTDQKCQPQSITNGRKWLLVLPFPIPSLDNSNPPELFLTIFCLPKEVLCFPLSE